MIKLLLIIIAVEAFTEIIVSSDLLIGFRNFCARINPWFLGRLLGCGYCLSVWVSIPFAIYYEYSIVNNLYVDFVIKWMLIHRLSNIVHDLFKRCLDRYPFTFLIQRMNIGMDNKDNKKD